MKIAVTRKPSDAFSIVSTPWNVDVYLDGVQVIGKIFAIDKDAGVVYRYKLDAAGKFIIEDDDIVEERVCGKLIKIRARP